MTRNTLRLPPVAARPFVSLVFLLGLGTGTAALGQDEPAPASDAPPAEAPPADAAAPADPGTGTIPVDQPPQEPPQAQPAEPAGAAAAKEGTQLDTIEVTGSRIKRSDYESEAPVLIIKREDIEKSGMVSIGEILQNLPQAGASLSRAFNNGGNGATEIDLRNLGSNRVLVLVNGRRWIGGTNPLNTAGVDLSTIPISVIDSIEVLKDGASAVYGSDAIAGVVNIKTKRDFVGAEARGHWDTTIKGDGQQKLLSLAGGTVAGKTSVFFNVDYVDQDALLSGSRGPSSVPVYRTGVTRGSSFSPYSRVVFVPTPQNANAINSAAGAAPTGTAPCYDITGGLGSNTAVTDGGETSGTPVEGTIGVPPTNTGSNTLVNLPAGGAASLCDLTIDPATFVLGGTEDWVRWDQNVNAYNYAPINYLITPVQRNSIYGQLSHQLLDNLRFSTEVLFNHRKSQQQLAQTPLACGNAFGAVHPFDYCTITADDPYNPTNPQSPHYIPGTQPQQLDTVLGAVLRRFNEAGPRLFTQSVDTSRVGMGLDGSFGGDGLFAGKPVIGSLFDRLFSWDAGWATTSTHSTDTDAGLLDGVKVAFASSNCENASNFGTTNPLPSEPCVPLDWFGGPGSVTKEMLDYVTYTGVDTSKQSQGLGYANMSTEIPELSRWLAGPLGLAFGVEYRKEYFDLHPDPLKVNTTSSTNAIEPTNGSYNAKEAYVEMRIPALADILWDSVPGLNRIGYLKGRSLVKELEFSLAGRYSNYSGFGENVSGKAGVRYKPYDELILRSTYSSAFRAPAITDLYLGQLISFVAVSDPCAGRNDPTRDNEEGIQNVRTNCDADGAAASQTNSQIPTTFGGNPDLQPETAHTLSVGFVYSPAFLPDFNAYMDWYQVSLKNFITALGPDQVLDLCYRSDPNNRAYCDLVSRVPGTTGGAQLDRINSIYRNFAALEVSGIDFNADWILPLPETILKYGSWKWQIDAAYVTQYDQIVPTGLGTLRVGTIGRSLGGFGGVPRLKFNTGFTWALGNWDASWNIRYIHRLTEICDDGRGDSGVPHATASDDVLGNPTKVNTLAEFGVCSDPGNVSNEMKWVAYHDVQGNYTLPNWNTKLTLGVNNLFNQDPPITYTAFADSYEKSIYDTYDSMTPYVGFQVNF